MCSSDLNFARISHPIEGSIQFSLYPFQKDIIRDFVSHRFVIVNKGRQLGISTTTAAYVAWMMLFHREKSILVVATKLATAANLVRKVKSIIKNLPPWLSISKIKFDNKNSFELENGSWVKASSTSGDAGRSEALSLLVVDEAAHIENMEEMWAAMYPTLSTGGRCIAVSTPYGVGNWFHRIYTEAEGGKNNFYPVKLFWNVHPDRDDVFLDVTAHLPREDLAVRACFAPISTTVSTSSTCASRLSANAKKTSRSSCSTSWPSTAPATPSRRKPWTP